MAFGPDHIPVEPSIEIRTVTLTLSPKAIYIFNMFTDMLKHVAQKKTDAYPLNILLSVRFECGFTLQTNVDKRQD